MSQTAADFLKSLNAQKPPSQKISAADFIKTYATQNPDVTNNNEGTNDIHENNDSFGHTLSSFVNYLSTLPKLANENPGTQSIFAKGNPGGISQSNNDLTIPSVKQVGNNIVSDVSNAFDYYKKTPASQIFSDAAGLGSQIWNKVTGNDDSKGSMLGGLFTGLVQKPIETLTQTVNDNGTARPATVQEQAQNLQASAALVAQISVFKAVKAMGVVDNTVASAASKMNPGELGPISDVGNATDVLQPTRLGPIAVSGALKQGAKYVGSDILAGGVAGGVGGAISGAGQDNQADQIISGALSFIPLSAAFGLLGVKGYVSDLAETRNRLQVTETLRATHDMAAINSLRINPSDPISTLLANTDAVKSGDNLTKAAINAKLSVGDGYIVENVSPSLGDQLGSGAIPSDKGYPDNYVAPKGLKKPRPRPNSTEVKFESDFDKLAYLAAAKKPSPYVESLIDNAQQQTGLSREEIISHGKYVRKQQLSAFKQEKLIPRTQAEIDAYNNASVDNGKTIAASLPEGNSIKDNNGVTWTRIGNSIKNEDGSQILPLDQNNTLQIIGRKKSDTPFYQPYQLLGKQTFNPNFGRLDVSNGAPVEVNYYHSPANGSLLVTPLKYTPDAINFFKKSGYIKGEVVTFNGMDHIVSGMDEGKVTLKNVSNSKIEFAEPGEIRRTNYSITPEIISKQYTTGRRSTDINPSSNGMTSADANGVINLPVSIIRNEHGQFELPDDPSAPVFTTKEGAEAYANSKRSVERRVSNNNPVINKPVGVKAPVLDASNLVERLYPQFLKGFLASPDDESFAGFTQKFYSQVGVEPKDYNHISSVFTKYLADDLANKILEPEELASRNRLMSAFRGLKDEQELNGSYWLTRQAEQNGLTYSPEGGGKYRLRLKDGGQTVGIVGSPDEALKFINQIRQTQGLPLDGGYSGSVPPGIGNLGGLDGGYTPVQFGALQNRIALSRLSGYLKYITPIGHRLKSLDDLSEGRGNFYPAFLDMQQADINRNNIVDRTPAISSLQKNMQAVLDFGRSFSPSRREVIADNLDTGTIDDIKNRRLSRPMNAVEDNLAKEISKTDVGAVQDLLFKTKMASPNSNLGSQAFMTTLQDLGKTADPNVLKAANLFATLVPKTSKDVISGDAVLELAHAYENPSTALSQIEHARINNLSARELKYGDMVRSVLKQAADVAGIDDKATYQMYLPSLIRRYAVGNGDLTIPEGFAREMSRVGITPKNVLIRDPNELLNKYFVATVNHLSGFNDKVREFQDNIKQNLDALKGTKIEGMIPTLSATLDQYTRTVSGYKSVDDNLLSAGRRVGAALGLKNIDINSVISLQALGSLALKPALATRDFLNVMGQTYASFGREFTQKAFADAISAEFVKWMKDHNLLPNSSTRALLDPGVDTNDMIQGNATLRKAANFGFNISGQEFAYEHANAGLYKAGMEMAEKYFDQLRRGVITKDQAFDKLSISSNFGPGLVKQIDNLLTEGRPDRAADLYSQSVMRFVSHVYGFHNNPMGWETNFGRLLSQWGSWSANATNSMIDTMTRGSKMQIAGKLSRTALFNLAMTTAGASLGFNLKSWTIYNPMNILPNVGPVASLPGDISSAYNQGKPISSELTRDLMGFMPYYGAASNWVKSLDLVGQGQFIQGLGKSVGVPILQ